MKKLFTLLFSSILFTGAFAQTVSTTVVISQLYGGGGATSGSPTYANDFVELHNVSGVAQDISGFSIQYGSATGNYGSSAANIFVFPAGTIIPAGCYLLIQTGNTGTAGAPLPVPADFATPTTGFSMSGASGKLALSNQAASLACGSSAIPAPCGPTDFAKIVDAVSYGIANSSEGAPVSDGTALNSAQGIARKNLGCQDTQNNNADFDVVQNPIPRNSATAAFLCTSLPLNLVSFKAFLTERNVQLSWTSLNEQNVKGFVVERSNNGSEFSLIGNISATNRSNASYSFNDNAPLSGAGYYRLRMTDVDGAVKYSAVVIVNNRRTMSAQVFPNPTRGNLNISHPKALTGALINVLAADGRQVMTYKVEQGSMQTNLNLSELRNGNYLLVFDNDGVKSTTKFVKN